MLLKNAGELLPLAEDTKVYVAGSNADDIGNQIGRLDDQLAGRVSGATTPGTTILDGISRSHRRDGDLQRRTPRRRRRARRRRRGGRRDARTRRASGTSATAAPTCRCPRADRAAVDKVCGAMKCAVLVVSGRPMLLGDRVRRGRRRVVASWLPGTEGAGVADVAVRRRAVHRPAAEHLAADRWRSSRSTSATRPTTRRTRTAGVCAPTPPGRACRPPGTRWPPPPAGRATWPTCCGCGWRWPRWTSRWPGPHWHPDGSVRDQAVVLAGLTGASALLEGTSLAAARAQFDPIVSVARDLAQARGVSARTSALTANAEQELLAGHPYRAMRQFTAALRLERSGSPVMSPGFSGAAPWR